MAEPLNNRKPQPWRILEQRAPALAALVLAATGLGLSRFGGAGALAALLLAAACWFLPRGRWLIFALALGFLSGALDQRNRRFWEGYFALAGFAEITAAWDEDVYLPRAASPGETAGWVWIRPLDSGGTPAAYRWRVWMRVSDTPSLPLRSAVVGSQLTALVATKGTGPPRFLECGPPRKLEPASGFWSWRAAWIARLEQTLTKAGHPEGAGLLRALLTGNRRGISEAIYRDFARLNLLHLLALSGLNVGLLYLAASRGLRLCGVGARAAGACSVVMVLGYGFLGGWAYSLKRAAGMCILAAAAGWWGRRASPVRWNLLAFFALAEILLDPGAALSVSFQLSYLGVAGLFWASVFLPQPPPGKTKPRLWKRWLRGLGETYLTGWGAMLFTWPVVAATFGVVPNWGSWLLSAPIVLLFPPVLVIALLGSALLLAGLPVPGMLWWFLEGSESAIRLISSGQAWVSPITAPFHPAWLLPWYAGLLGLWLWRSVNGTETAT